MQTADKLKTPDNLQLTQCTVLSTFTYSALSFSNIEKKLVNNHLKQIYFYTVHVFFFFFLSKYITEICRIPTVGRPSVNA